jgi:lysozyme
MQLSQNGWTFLENNEGCVLHPYLDGAGIPTIGIGSTFYPNGKHVTMQDSDITVEMAKEYAQSEVNNVQYAVTKMTPSTLNQNQFDSLVDFSYNEGTGALHGSTLLRLIQANTLDPGIRAAFQMWDKLHVDGVLRFDQGLLDRRNREADLYFS